ncbi:MAG: ATP-binding cassette domain-containing protein [Chloroflexota bacterium]|nr:ATP-binding cassette domain-containing protein [Chloroflexota bacterium]
MTAPGPGEPLIEVRDLHFRYPTGRSDALDGIDLTVRRGEFVGVTGPSGAGKSTLCLCLKGLIPAGTFSGSIRVGGQEIRPNGPYVDSSALVFQDPETQIIGLTVTEDVAFGPENLERDPGEIRDAIPRHLQTVRLAGYADAETFRLSGGQKQRLAIADALILEPDLLILDEPTSELDPIGKDEVFEVVSRLREERAVTVVMVEHAAEQLAEMADRIVLMSEGRIVAQGRPEELYHHEDFFHRPDGERSPQVAQLLFELEREGLIDSGRFTAREDGAVSVLAEALRASRRVSAGG